MRPHPRYRFALAALAAVALFATACSPRTAEVKTAPAQQPDTPQMPAATYAPPKEVLPEPDLVDDPPVTLYPVLDGTALLRSPEAGSERMELLPASKPVIRFKLRGHWARVLDPASGHIGWLENRLLTPTPPANADMPGKGTISETF